MLEIQQNKKIIVESNKDMTVDDVIRVKTFKSSFLSNKNNSRASWCCFCRFRAAAAFSILNNKLQLDENETGRSFSAVQIDIN